MPVVAIFGPTGSGKTDVAVRVAAELGCSVINCDPAQIYKGLPILTNQPGPEHDAIAPHRLIGTWPLDHEATVAEYAHDVHAPIDEELEQHGWAVLCSGSGLYMRAALCELEWATEGPDEHIRAELHERYEREGAETLHRELQEVDAAAAANIHPNDRKRIVRALEAAQAGTSVAPDGSSMWDAHYRHPSIVFGLQIDRALVRSRIDARTEAMFEGGLLEEVASVVGERAERFGELSVTAHKLHGLSDCVEVLQGNWSRETAIDRMATRTRQYAKRQDTWARRWPGLQPVPISGTPEATARVLLDTIRSCNLQNGMESATTTSLSGSPTTV
jgi:tRNA dimethylallyltransferase